jgi:fucose permease
LIFPGSQVATWAGTLSTGFFMAAIFPTTLSLAERRMNITGQVTGWFFVGAGAGGMFLPWLIGQLFTPAGAQVTMITILADILVAVVIYLMLIQSSPRPLEAKGT